MARRRVDLERLTDALIKHRAGLVEMRLVMGLARAAGAETRHYSYRELLTVADSSRTALIYSIRAAVENGFLVVDKSTRPHGYTIHSDYHA